MKAWSDQECIDFWEAHFGTWHGSAVYLGQFARAAVDEARREAAEIARGLYRDDGLAQFECEVAEEIAAAILARSEVPHA